MLLHENLELLVDQVLRKALVALATGCALTALAFFFQSFCVSQRVQGVVRRGHAWTDAGQHDDFYFVVGNEGVSEDHCELALSEGDMLALRSLTTLLVECSHAFLESQKRLVDLSALSLPILVIALTILSPFTTSQIYQK